MPFRRYLKHSRRYGIKVFKLCGGAGYTHSFQTYMGKEKKRDKIAGNKSCEVVLFLCKNILDEGHTICTDNWYTSVDLMEKLITMNTHLVGTKKSMRKSNRSSVSKIKVWRSYCSRK